MKKRSPFRMRCSFVAIAWFLTLFSYPTDGLPQDASLADRVEIRRTQFGVPHILARDLTAAFFGLAYCHLEDHGERVVLGLIRSRGHLSRYLGSDSLDADLRNRFTYARAVETYHLLDQDTRDVFEGYAAGVNYYITLHPDGFPKWVTPTFTGHDVAARWIGGVRWDKARRFVDGLTRPDTTTARPPGQEGSNAWAFAPSRTRSGSAILLRNPHLNWDAGYYEAHLTVPDVVNFYGDFRVGYPLFFNGGFNDQLGWATTNNAPDLEEVYALEVDPQRPDHYLFDGGSVPLQRRTMTVEFKNGPGLAREYRDSWHTPLGPVIHRGGGKIYVMRGAGNGEFRKAQQFLRMMQARALEEWKEAMRLRAQTGSNFTYADREGNIYYVWNATIPLLPHDPGGDTVAVPVTRSSQVWTHLVPFDSLPQVRNPRGGYLHNENDPFHYANLNQPFDPSAFPRNFPAPRLGLRSQHSLQLIHGERKVTLEGVTELKHSMRMLVADRVKADLIQAVQAASPDPEIAAAIQLLDRWDNTVNPESRGGVLFETWVRRYVFGEEPPSSASFDSLWDGAFRHPWSPEEPTTTPRRLSDPARAREAFLWSLAETKRRYGRWDVAWGEVHRVRRGSVDVPVGGCASWLGCFRVLRFDEAEDGKRLVSGGDAWVLAVEFGDPPRAYSVLAYGQSSKEHSPHFDDQAKMFARGQLKRVAFTESEIEAALIRKYRPGTEPSSVKR